MTKVRERECSCGHKWVSPVVMSDLTQNLSGEATPRCPACGGANGAYVMSGPVKLGERHEAVFKADELQKVEPDALQSFTAGGAASSGPLSHAFREGTGGGPSAPVKRSKRVRPASRVKRWAEAVAKIQTAIDQARAALDDGLEQGVFELEELKEEFENWRDNLPENLQQSPLGEKLEAVCDLDIDFSDITSALDDAESKIAEAEEADLPLGFGRD